MSLFLAGTIIILIVVMLLVLSFVWTDVGDDEDALRAADGEKVPTSDHTHIHMSHVTQP